MSSSGSLRSNPFGSFASRRITRMGRCRSAGGGGTLSDVAVPTAKAAAPLSRKRRIVIWTLVVLGTVLALVAILTTWVNRQMLDNAAWNRATSQTIQDPQVQTALATYTVNQLYANVNVAQALEQRLPPQLDSLAPTIAGALQQPAIQGVKLALERPRI